MLCLRKGNQGSFIYAYPKKPSISSKNVDPSINKKKNNNGSASSTSMRGLLLVASDRRGGFVV
jgi:hypothetical protein